MNSLCNDCRNKNCPMQSGIKRTSCEFYKAPTKSGYIRVEDAIKKMQKQYDLLSDDYHAPHRNGIADCIEIMKDIPAADVRPVARGKWVPYPCMDDMYKAFFKCSVCGKIVSVPHGKTVETELPFCNCGACMNEEVNYD